ncbi:hypothetical protein H0G86_007808 [Trichoderma simmonsii]|uniref:Uncharacterized protein n=1 Tax=Trichoderma simmonsii TaxID=1491479 RepID=A0A8G0LJB9_9HYPO|nr:hypothetical protein H0G86_007808 [Trichoderma simmonsii]
MSGNKPNPVGAEESGAFDDLPVPGSFAGKGSGYIPAPRRKRGPARGPAPSPAVQNEHGGRATAATAELNNKNEHSESIGAAAIYPPLANDHTNPTASAIAISDEQSDVGEYTRKSEIDSLMGEESPILENDEMSLSVVNDDMTGFSPSQDLGQELEASSDESDEEDDYKAVTRDDIPPVDSPQLSPSIPSDDAMDAAGETGNDIVHPINAESDQNSRANIDEILAELDFLRKKVASRDERAETLRQEKALLKKQLESSKEKISAREAEIASQNERAETLRQEKALLKKQLESSKEKISAREAEIASQNERAEAISQENASLKEQLESHTEKISAREAEIAALRKTAIKANPSADVATNTETPAGQILQPNYPRKDDDEQRVISLEKPSSSPPVSSLAVQKARAVRRVQPFVAIAKDLYFDLTEAMNMGPKPSPLSDTIYVFQIWARAVIAFLATPIWTLASLFMYLSVQHEKNLWMQANALTRKQLLGQVSGATEDWTADWIWNILFTVGSVISLCKL